LLLVRFLPADIGIRYHAPTPMPKFTVAIIGGGFSGTAVAIQLARQGFKDALVYLIERRDEVGKGIAYGTSHLDHLLNVRAKGMSVLPDNAGHFVEWLNDLLPGQYDPEDFVPRAIYGQYVGSAFDEAVLFGPDTLSMRQVQGEAIALSRVGGKARILLASGREIDADHVVLATGHFPPGHPSAISSSLYGHPAYAPDPWSLDALADIRPGHRILLVGTGLTAIDLSMTILEDAPDAQVTFLSPRGEFPQVHKPASSYAHRFAGEIPSDLRGLVQFVRAEIRRSEAKGGEWRAVFDALRPHTISLWLGLTEADRRRFLRHVRPYFERYRHRMSEAIADQLHQLEEEGSIEVLSGSLAFAEDLEGKLRCVVKLQDGNAIETMFDRVVNCTGPLCDYRRMQHPLVRSLLDSGFMRPDKLGLGIDATPEGLVLGSEGTPIDWLSTLGPTLKGNLWETTAVPEIRVQAKNLAARLIG
jgi:uncharacterized NAD(P)/FAD-binding protein YdhS